MQERSELIADEGMIYTNGDVYGVIIPPAEGRDLTTFYQIPFEEYLEICGGQYDS